MKPYVPDSLPLDCLDVAKLIRRVGSANAAIARYDGLLQSVVNPAVMLSPLTQREAVLSSRIEGTQATVDEVLEYEAGIEFDPVTALRKLKEVGILFPIREASGRRPAVLAFSKLVNQAEARKVLRNLRIVHDPQTTLWIVFPFLRFTNDFVSH